MKISTRFGLALWLGVCCLAAQAGNLQVTVLDKDGKPVIDAVVVVQPSAASMPSAPLPQQATILQEKMRFSPPVTLVAVGARVRFVNNDPWEHHVRGSAAGIAQFDAAQTGGFELRMDGKAEGKPAAAAEATLAKAGPVLLGCHLHASMRGHVYVSDSPWAAISNAEGVVNFDGLPDGATQLRVWHADQLIDVPSQRIVMTAAPAKASLQLTVVPRRRRI